MIFSKKKYDYEESAKKLSVLFANNFPSNEFHRNLLKFLCETTDSVGAALVLKEKETFTVRHCLGWESFSFRMEECVGMIQWLKKNKGTITRLQLLEESRWAPIKKMGLNFFIQFQAEACLPLFVGEEMLGFVTLSQKREGRPFTAACRQILDWLGPQLAMSLNNSLLWEKIRYQNVELAKVNDLKSQIVANLSHELKTPLTAVIGFAELLAEGVDGELNGEQKKHITQVLDGSNRLLKILTALVDLAKLEAGNFPLNIQQFHLAPLVTSLSDELPLNRDTALQIEIDSDTPRIYGDLGLVRQIFRHLLDNAAKYTPGGSVKVSASKKGEVLEICVADTGIGIGPEKMPRIFDDFYQADGGITRRFEGSGLGLTLSKKWVELHGGRLWAKSQLGKGSQFYFTLPLKPIVIKHRELAA